MNLTRTIPFCQVREYNVSMSKFLGVDYGERRIGLALSESDTMVVIPWKTLEVSGEIREAVRAVVKVCSDEDITDVVVGMPKSLSGGLNAQARTTKDFIMQLRTASGLPIHEVDERLTTKMSETLLGKTKRRNNVDQIAAALILETYHENMANKAFMPSPSRGKL